MILDPTEGDFEDDSSSPKTRSLFALAGSLLAEISLPKLIIAWVLMIALPGLALGAVPILVGAWFTGLTAKFAILFTGLVPVLVFAGLIALGWIGFRRVFAQAERNFWALNALAVQPGYVLCREVLRHLAETRLAPGASDRTRLVMRAAIAAAAGLAVALMGAALAALAWQGAAWTIPWSDLPHPGRWIPVLVANAVLLMALYFAAAGLIWGIADSLTPQPRDLPVFATPVPGQQSWRVVHLSDIHIVGEHWGRRIECGRAGPRGNHRLVRLLERLAAIHAAAPLDLVLITGDMTDAGRSAEWAEFFRLLDTRPELRARTLALPGNHDVNVVDRASPARLELPGSPMQTLRRLRTLSALDALQGPRVHVVSGGSVGATLSEFLSPHRAAIQEFAAGGIRPGPLAPLWDASFPQILPPATPDGLGVLILDSNAQTHFSFTNALGLVSAQHAHALDTAIAAYPTARWIVALHHHVVEYPRPAHALSERIGTALINGTWFVRWLQRLGNRAIVMHGHRHIDWIGACGAITIVSAPSPVMGGPDTRPTYCWLHTLSAQPGGSLGLLPPERIALEGDTAQGM